jgi:hypothetical protein
MTRTLRSLKHPRTLLQSSHSRISDRRLIADVELCSLSTAVFDTFGADVMSPFDPARTPDIEQLGRLFEDWHKQWSEILGDLEPSHYDFGFILLLRQTLPILAGFQRSITETPHSCGPIGSSCRRERSKIYDMCNSSTN